MPEWQLSIAHYHTLDAGDLAPLTFPDFEMLSLKSFHVADECAVLFIISVSSPHICLNSYLEARRDTVCTVVVYLAKGGILQYLKHETDETDRAVNLMVHKIRVREPHV